MDRRTVLKALAGLPLAGLPLTSGRTTSGRGGASMPVFHVSSDKPGWPDPAEWAALGESVGGRLVEVRSPFAVCKPNARSAACANLFQDLLDPFFIQENAALTQTLGWTDAWTSRPSAYAVLASSSADVAAAVNFARDHHVRLVVKGGGHSYIGASNAPDSLLIWTRPNMQAVELLDSFVPQGGAGQVEPETAVRVGAGAIWMDAYSAVTTIGGRYVQGGGCTTVGVPGLVQGGGFGSFSKGFGTAGANLLEAEIVTADGTARIVNAFQDPDLYWALKGGGGGTFGVITQLTLRTHDLPAHIGAVNALVTATSDAAYRALVGRLLSFYRENLLNPHWGEQIHFGQGLTVTVSMVSQGLDQAQIEHTWAPLFDWIKARPADYTLSGQKLVAGPAQDYWDAAAYERLAPGTVIVPDPLPGAPTDYFYWQGDAGEAGQWLHAYQSTWLSRQLLTPQRQPALVDALASASALWQVSLHCNKGLAGAPANARAWTADTPMNPAVLDAFALVIAGANEQVFYPGITGHEPDLAQGRQQAATVAAAVAPLKALRERPACYVWETDYFQEDWQTAFWGDNYARLLRVKKRYDPDGLFHIHHGVGTET
jgi:FAD/FMN-containing dehydrogenase